MAPVIMRLAEPESMDDFRADAVLASIFCFEKLIVYLSAGFYN